MIPETFLFRSGSTAPGSWHLSASTLTVLALSACVSVPWPVPQDTPPDVVETCRDEATISPAANPGSINREITSNVPGSADEAIEDAQSAEQSAELGSGMAERLFYQCLVRNGVELEQEQRAVLEGALDKQ